MPTLKRPPTTTPRLYAQDGKGYEATVHAHYFVGNCDWFVTEYDPGDDIAFGWACLGDRNNAELGYTSIAELEAVSVPQYARVRGSGGELLLGMVNVEYDEHWRPVTLTAAIAALAGGAQ